MDWLEDKVSGIIQEEEVTHTEKTPLYNKLKENENKYALFTGGSCHIVRKLGYGRPLSRVLCDKFQELLKEKVNQGNMQR